MTTRYPSIPWEEWAYSPYDSNLDDGWLPPNARPRSVTVEDFADYFRGAHGLGRVELGQPIHNTDALLWKAKLDTVCRRYPGLCQTFLYGNNEDPAPLKVYDSPYCMACLMEPGHGG